MRERERNGEKKNIIYIKDLNYSSYINWIGLKEF